MTVGKKRINVSTIYRHPLAPTAQFFKEFNVLCDALELIPGEHIILGDFYCPEAPNTINH